MEKRHAAILTREAPVTCARADIALEERRGARPAPFAASALASVRPTSSKTAKRLLQVRSDTCSLLNVHATAARAAAISAVSKASDIKTLENTQHAARDASGQAGQTRRASRARDNVRLRKALRENAGCHAQRARTHHAPPRSHTRLRGACKRSRLFPKDALFAARAFERAS